MTLNKTAEHAYSVELILRYFTKLSEQQIAQFTQLQAVYNEWNEQINVVSRKDIQSLYLHHVLHSLSIAQLIGFAKGANVLDVGTGGGFPTIPLAILFPNTHFMAIDAIGKKIKVVQAVCDALNLQNVEAVHQHATEVKKRFDFVLGRGVTNLSDFLTWTLPLVGRKSSHALPNGVICLKGGDLKDEIHEAKQKHNLANKQVVCYPINRFFEEEFFETKQIIYVQK